MSTFTEHTPDTAPEDSQPLMASALSNFGFLPAPVARMATSPDTLRGFMSLNKIFENSSLDHLSRETLVLTVATRHECHYCVAMHSTLLERAGVSPELIDGLRRQQPLAEPRLEAMRRFVHQVIDHSGAVPEIALRAFLAAGYDTRNALDAVLGIATYTLSTFANRLTRAPLDEPFRAWQWHEEHHTIASPGSRAKR